MEIGGDEAGGARGGRIAVVGNLPSNVRQKRMTAAWGDLRLLAAAHPRR
jgi:hypothetical protein